MPIKKFLYRFQPAPLYIILVLSICYFCVQLILSHLTHALTLLMASYHMLCNIFALAGSIITIKHNELHNNDEERKAANSNLKTQIVAKEISSLAPLSDKTNNGINATKTAIVLDANKAVSPSHQQQNEFRTQNTFGWARIEILTMLIVCITLASLSFSLLVEALQTLVHIDHQDSMHLPVHVMILGVVGLLLNGFTYLLIGGYTMHQGSFLRINPSNGKVILESSKDEVILTVNTANLNAHSDQQLKEDLKAEIGKIHYHQPQIKRQGSAELLRDVSSTLFVIVCAVIVYLAQDKEHTAKFIDPVLSIFSCILVVALSYPYMKESCMILLQTIPGTIDMDAFERNLVTKFPQIVSYHDLHIWQLSSHKYIATVHIIFQNEKLYAKTIEDVRSHFHEHSIAHVTIQPEFQNDKNITSSMECLMACQQLECLEKVCCKDSMTDLREISVSPDGSSCEKADNKSKKHHHHHQHHGHSHEHRHSHAHSNNYKHKHSHDHGQSNKNNKCTKEVPKIQNESKELNEIKKQTTTAIAVNEAVEKDDSSTQQITILNENHKNLSKTNEYSSTLHIQEEISHTEVSSADDDTNTKC